MRREVKDSAPGEGALCENVVTNRHYDFTLPEVPQEGLFNTAGVENHGKSATKLGRARRVEATTAAPTTVCLEGPTSADLQKGDCLHE
jgi:hypothetical protein